jgi:hypothetical protein
MGGVNFNTSANFQVPGSQQGAPKGQAELEKMPTDQLVKHWQNSTGAEKEAAFAELQKRLSELLPEKAGEKDGEKGEKGEKGGGEKGVSGGEKGGSGGSLEELLKQILEKLKSGQPLTPEEQELANKLGLKTSEKNSAPPDQGGDPNNIPSNIVPPGKV